VSRSNDKISDDDIGAWRLIELLFSVAWRHVVRAQDAGLPESLRASKSAKARIDSSCTCGVLKHESKSAKKLQGLSWKEL
jgi:uncharacterized protein YfiM (DUF2279 family)